MYTLEGVMITGEQNYKQAETKGILQDDPEITNPENYTYSGNVDEGGFNPLGLVIGFLSFMSFAPLGLPEWAFAIINVCMTIIFITLVYLIYTFIRDWIPFVG